LICSWKRTTRKAPIRRASTCRMVAA
jgi:hypothetical protein